MGEKMKCLPGWKIVRTIGKGSFGTVCEIEKEDEFGAVIHSALKVISIPETDAEIKDYRDDGYDDASITALFKSRVEDVTAEFKLMNKLKGHSNIVSFEDYSIVQHDNVPGYDILIRMELLTPLPDYINRQFPGGEIPDKAAIGLGVDMCRALELCKKNRIIHRDIKPQNIFVNENGDFKLGDFGVAKTSDHTTRATKTGTFGYMAPEVYWGKPYNASADLYSLGLVMYWMLNERRGPFLPLPPVVPKSVQNAEAMDRRMAGESLPAPKHGSEALKRIILRACAFDPNDRYENPTEMKRDLERLAVEAVAEEPHAEPKQKNIPFTADDGEKTFGVFGDRSSTPVEPSVEEEKTFGVFGGKPSMPEEPPTEEDKKTFGIGSETPVRGVPEKPEPVRTETAEPNTQKKASVPVEEGEKTFGIFGARRPKEPEPVPADDDATVSVKEPAQAGPAEKPVEPKKETKPVETKKETKPVEPKKETKPVRTEPEQKEKPVKTKPAEKKQQKTKSKLPVILSIAAALVIAAVVLIVVLAGKGKKTSQVAEQPTTEPVVTAAPTPEPTPSPEPVVTDSHPNTVNVGDIVVFGSYEQDNNEANGKEDITWRVLAVDGDKVLAISINGLDVQSYASSRTSTTWKTSFIREWLNDTFLNAAFNTTQQGMILDTPVMGNSNPTYNTADENSTTDKVFLLNATEAETYFLSDRERQCLITDYAKAKVENDVLTNEKSQSYHYSWWLRTPGKEYDQASVINPDGTINLEGVFVDCSCLEKTVYGNGNEVETEEYYICFREPCFFFSNNSVYNFYTNYKSYFINNNGTDIYAKYIEAENDYIPVTDEMISDLIEISRKFGDGNPEAWKEWCFAPIRTETDAIYMIRPAIWVDTSKGMGLIVAAKTEGESEPTPKPTPTPNPVVTFQDAAFEKAFRMEYNKSGTIYQSDILAVRGLFLGNHALKDISDIALFKNLVDLSIGGNQISDISALKELTELTTLDICCNQISDISALSGLTNLQILYCECNQISDISALSGLTNLTELWSYSNQISDISAVKGMTKLKRLNFGDNKISDISALKGLTNLTYLSIGCNQVVDLSAINGLTQLTGLDADINQISDISVLRNMTNLTELSLGENQISDISVISGLTNLSSASLNGNQISDISALQGLTKLSSLSLSHNQISDISPLSNLKELTWLQLGPGNHISDLTPLYELQKLENLGIEDNSLTQNRINEIKEKLPKCEITVW